MNKMMAVIACSTLALALTGCGSDDNNNSDFSDGYVQLYNVSANSYPTSLNLDGNSIGTASFGDATSAVAVNPDTYDLTFSYTDQFGDLVETDSQEISVREGEKTLYIVYADDQTNPGFENNILVYTWERDTYENDDGDDQFVIQLTNLSSFVGDLDVYIAESGVDFNNATLIGTASQNALIETEAFDEDEYRFFVTESGSSDVVFQSDLANFQFSTEYLIAVLDSFGPSQFDYSIDIVSNSSTVTHLADEEASGQFRVVNTVAEYANAVLSVSTDGTNFDEAINPIGSFTPSEYYVNDLGDYQISISNDGQAILDNYLLTLNANESKALVFYENQQATLSAIALDEEIFLSSNDHRITAVNLTTQDDFDIAFVGDDETTETAEYSINNLDSYEDKSERLVTGTYDILLLKEDDNDQNFIVARIEQQVFEEAANYMLLIVEDENQTVTFQLTQ